MANLPTAGIQGLDAGSIADLVKAVMKEEKAVYTITANVVNLNQTADAFVDDVEISQGGAGNISSFTNLNKIGRYFRIINRGAGAITITAGNNIDITGAAATAVLAISEYVWCYNDGTTVYVQSIHKWA